MVCLLIRILPILYGAVVCVVAGSSASCDDVSSTSVGCVSGSDDVNIDVDVHGLIESLEGGGVGDRAVADELSSWVSDAGGAKGMHVLAVSDAGEKLSVKAFKDGRREDEVSFLASKKSLSSFRAIVELKTGIKNKDSLQGTTKQQPWAIYSSAGQRLNTLEDIIQTMESSSLADGAIFVAFEGGQWIWPGVKIGFERPLTNFKDESMRDVAIKTLSMQPLVFEVLKFLRDEECEGIIDVSRNKVKLSGVAHMDHDKGKDSTQWRTSATHWLHKHEHPSLKWIDERIENLTNVPASHYEPVQVLRYQKDQKYDAHHDYFNPQFYKDNTYIEDGHKNRMITVFWYLTTVDKGGETGFPRAGGLPPVRNFVGCKGYPLKSKAIKGKVIVFYNLRPNGELDEYSLHAGCPVESDEMEKWSANKWVWNKPR